MLGIDTDTSRGTVWKPSAGLLYVGRARRSTIDDQRRPDSHLDELRGPGGAAMHDGHGVVKRLVEVDVSRFTPGLGCVVHFRVPRHRRVKLLLLYTLT